MRSLANTFVSGGFSRAWHRSDLPDVPLSDRARNELSGAVAYVFKPGISVFGSVGTTIATVEENGAGTTIALGVSFYAAAPRK